MFSYVSNVGNTWYFPFSAIKYIIFKKDGDACLFLEEDCNIELTSEVAEGIKTQWEEWLKAH